MQNPHAPTRPATQGSGACAPSGAVPGLDATVAPSPAFALPSGARGGDLLEEGYDALLAGDGELARSRFLEAEEELPGSQVPGVLLATLDLVMGAPEDSHQRLMELRARHPGCPLVRAHLVEVLIAQGRHAPARAELQRLRRLELTPEIQKLADALGQLLSLPPTLSPASR